MEPNSSENISSTTHANMDRDRVSPSHAGKQLGQFTPESYNCHVETATALLTSIQSPTAGLTAGVSITDCGAQTEKDRRGGTPGQTRSSDCKPQESQEARETNRQCSGPRDGSGTVGGDRGTRTVGVDKGPGQCRKCACRHSVSTDWTNPGGEERKGPVDSIKNSWYHLSQTHPVLSEYLPQTPQHDPHTSRNLSSSPGTQTSVFNPPQPQLQINTLYVPRQHWESSAVNHQHLCQTNSAPPPPQQVQSAQLQNLFSQTPLRQTDSQPDHSRQTSVSTTIQQVTCDAGGSTVTSCCSKSTAGIHRSKHASLSSDITTSLSNAGSPSVHTSVSKSAMTQDIWVTNRASDIAAGQPPKPPASINQEPKDYTTYDYTAQSGNAAGDDIISKYQSYFLVGQLHSYQPECMATAVRPVPNCQDYADGTSSSDDEGKLIIEL
ncbi:uncharacterized protein LOC117507481 [Thalassophryne amazonica]|uniref:uncharacterized protein LOC117507481 n=1 Tax=Thalassophryne amazonica TaxID=390379 RepID=UPI0014709766|nr:uncharacterized protein LOC117507481 [Thalassophryne amazonica]